MTHASELLDTSPFHILERPVRFISYGAQREAASFLKQTYGYDHGLGVFYGPPLSGKRTLVRHFIEKLPDNATAAVVDAAGLDVETFLEALTHEFGLDMGDVSVNVMMNMVKVFAVQHTSSSYPPLLVIDNVNAMKPETVHILSQLAKLAVHSQSALRILLLSDCRLDKMLAAPGLKIINARKTGEHELGAMTRAETAYYIDAKLRCAGVEHPEDVLSSAETDELFDDIGGRPGLIDRAVLQHLTKSVEKAERAPLRAVTEDEWREVDGDTPKLIITKDGKTIGTIELDKPRLMIGRSEYNDVIIDSNYISRHHALIVRDEGVTVLTDLNSTNGVYVNSQRVFVHGLRHDDVISLGNHGIKLFDPSQRERAEPDESALVDTATMKALCDVRHSYARESMNLQRMKLEA